MTKYLTTEDLLVRHAERAVFLIWCKETINPCLKRWGQPTQLMISNTKKEIMEPILAQSINSNSLWEKFYTTEQGSQLDPGSIDDIQAKISGYANFLITKHKQKYQYIPNSGVYDQFCVTIGFSAVMKSAECRHEEKRFDDPEANQRVARLLERREENVALAKGWGHARKHGEDPAQTLTPVFDVFQDKVNEQFFPAYTEELPPLPAGMTHPLSWLLDQLQTTKELSA
jgi:hypothetical protein